MNNNCNKALLIYFSDAAFSQYLSFCTDSGMECQDLQIGTLNAIIFYKYQEFKDCKKFSGENNFQFVCYEITELWM